MATINWPLTLPRRFLAAGLNYGFKPLAQITQPEIGPARVRRRSTAIVYQIDGTIVLRQNFPVKDASGTITSRVNQVQAFLTFLETTSEGGTLLFDWVDPVFPPANIALTTFTVADYDVEMLLTVTDPSQILASAAQYGPGAMTARLSMEMYK